MLSLSVTVRGSEFSTIYFQIKIKDNPLHYRGIIYMENFLFYIFYLNFILRVLHAFLNISVSKIPIICYRAKSPMYLAPFTQHLEKLRMFWRARNHIRQVHHDTRKTPFRGQYRERPEPSWRNLATDFTWRRVLSRNSRSQPANLVRSLGKFTRRFRCPLEVDNQRAYPNKTYPSLVGNSRGTRRFRKCLDDPVIPVGE